MTGQVTRGWLQSLAAVRWVSVLVLLGSCLRDSTTPSGAPVGDWTTARLRAYDELKISYPRVVSASPDGGFYLLRSMDSLTFGLSVARRDAARTTRTWTFADRPIGMEWAPEISKGYYGLDQGPIVMMIENHR